MVKLADVRVGVFEISLSKLAGKVIKDVHGYITRQRGEFVFKVTDIVFEDGTELNVEGEYDFPYLGTPYSDRPIPNLDDEVLEDLYRQGRIEDGELDEDES